MKKGDFIIYVCAVVLALAPLLFFMAPKQEPARAVVRIDGRQVRSFLLSRDAEETFETANGSNTVVVRDGKVSITTADCPDHTCIAMGPIDTVNETLVCLPNRLTVLIEGHDDDAPDAVAQ